MKAWNNNVSFTWLSEIVPAQRGRADIEVEKRRIANWSSLEATTFSKLNIEASRKAYREPRTSLHGLMFQIAAQVRLGDITNR